MAESPLTMLDAVYFVVAIPATVTQKLFLGQSPTRTPGVDDLSKSNIDQDDLEEKDSIQIKRAMPSCRLVTVLSRANPMHQQCHYSNQPALVGALNSFSSANEQ